MNRHGLFVIVGTALACGCIHAGSDHPDYQIPELPSHYLNDLGRLRPPPSSATPIAQSSSPAQPEKKTSALPLDASPAPQRGSPTAKKSEAASIILVGAEEPKDKDQQDQDQKSKTKEANPPEVPPELPGSSTPFFKGLPKDEKERAEVLRKYFPPLPDVPPDLPPAPGPDGKPLTLADLQKIGTDHSPQIKQALADIQAARGAMIQAGLHPNPNVGYEGDTMGTAGLPGYQGGFVEQTVKTAGKLTYAKAAAEMDLRNAELALRSARVDLATRIRNGYFGVLVAQESVRVNRALVRFTDEIYQYRLRELQFTDQLVPYETAQFRIFAVQARTALVQSLNRYVAAWKQLATAAAVPGLTPTMLAGQADMPIPSFNHGQVLAQIMSRHTDILTAENGIIKAKWNLLLAKVTPIPDIDLRVMLQKDYTSNTFLLTPSVAVSGPVPIWDQNQGNIMQAQGQLAHAQEDVQRARNDLTARLADAFERYETNRQQLEYYRDHILPDLVQVYHGSVLRYKADTKNPLTFLDIVTPQQNLAGGIATYLSTLQGLWTAVVDVASLLQTEDLFGLVQGGCIEPMTDLAGLVVAPRPGPSCHSGEDPRLLVPNPHWPSAVQPRLPLEPHPEEGQGPKPELLPAPRSNPDKPAEPVKPENGSSDQPGPAEPLLQLPPVPEVKGQPPRVRAEFAADRRGPLAIPSKNPQVTPAAWGQQR